MNAESAPKGAPGDSGHEVEGDSSGGEGQDVWAKVPRAVAMMDLTTPALRLFIVISSYADGRTRLAWPSQSTLALDLGWITRSTDEPDRRRVSHALTTLVEADLIREAGRHRHGERAWTNRYLVAPFPSEDAAPTYASSKEPEAEDAYKTVPTMRRKSAEDAYPTYARTDLLNRPSKSEELVAEEKHEEQEPDHRGSYASFNHDPRPRWRRATQSEEAR